METLTLNSREWKPFFIEQVAEINSGKDIYERERTEGTTPYITATANNNGIGYFVGNTNETMESECLSVNRNGSVGYCFYHPYPALYGNDTRKLRPKIKNKYVSLFISMCITSQREKYGYGYKMGTGRLKRQRILLPVNQDDTPDWQFMEEYMREKERQILKPTIDKLRKQLVDYQIDRGGVIWNSFFIKDLFSAMEPGRSKGLNHLQQTDTGISYLGATNQNNGVLCFVTPCPGLVQRGGCIAFIRNGEGSMGYSVYKAEDFIATSDMTLAYHPRLNRYTGTFITTVADRIRGKYNFGYKRSATRLAKEILTLPTTPDGQPDWLFMENYMRHIESQKIYSYLTHISERLD